MAEASSSRVRSVTWSAILEHGLEVGRLLGERQISGRAFDGARQRRDLGLGGRPFDGPGSLMMAGF
jgi:hypothetical protein